MGEYRPFIIAVNVSLGIGLILMGVYLVPFVWPPSSSETFLHSFEKVDRVERYSDVRKLLWRQPKKLDDRDIDAAADALSNTYPQINKSSANCLIKNHRCDKWIDPEYPNRWVFVVFSGELVVLCKAKVGYHD